MAFAPGRDTDESRCRPRRKAVPVGDAARLSTRRPWPAGRCALPRPAARLDDMITTTALTKSYRNAPVVREVSLHCEPGTITGFLGPNGAGKSTTLRMIVGLARPDRGTSSIAGRPFVELP